MKYEYWSIGLIWSGLLVCFLGWILLVFGYDWGIIIELMVIPMWAIAFWMVHTDMRRE